MLVHLVAREYRNFASLDLAIPASGLVIVGENGHGKTNLLEAVAYLALLRSFRGARDADVIRFDEVARRAVGLATGRATARPTGRAADQVAAA